MNYTAKLFGILLLTSCFGISASNADDLGWTGGNDKNKESKEVCDQDSTSKKFEEVKQPAKPVNYAEASQKSRQAATSLTNKADSSSVLSYNFIFYLVYKFKYSESEEGFSQDSRTTD